jgi:MFS superfamily sulfate permease-like transporter
MTKNSNVQPKDGIQGLIENFKEDFKSGFMVALLALPLSLGIASASDYPNPMFGVITAIVGGLIVSWVMGARLTIKGPAAGLIVIVAGAVNAFGGGEVGWHLALGAIIVAGLLQIVFGLLKWGKLSDFFPLTAVHGMLAAIGIIILSKQLHILMGISPTENGKPLVEPIELIEHLPSTIAKMMTDPVLIHSFWIGLISLIVVFGFPMLKNKWIKQIPMPLIVLAISVPLGMYLGLTQENKQLVKVGDFGEILGWHANFGGVAMTGTFIQYVLLFAIIGSLESLLTAKAMDILDPFKRKTDFNRDLIAVGSGNMIAGALGGLPMISEVARSSYNINNGGKTRWANFFHGLSLLLMVLFFSSFIEMIPKSALAALLIGVGFKLTHPREFKHTLKIGKEQLIVFVTTIIFTLTVDLLVGILAGMLAEVIIQIFFKVPVWNILKASVERKDLGNNKIRLSLKGAAVFTNYLSIKKFLDELPMENHVEVDLSQCKLVDHTVMENLHFFEREYRNSGGHIHIVGLDEHSSLSDHPQSVKVKK